MLYGAPGRPPEVPAAARVTVPVCLQLGGNLPGSNCENHMLLLPSVNQDAGTPVTPPAARARGQTMPRPHRPT